MIKISKEFLLIGLIITFLLAIMAFPTIGYSASPADCDAYARRMESNAGPVLGGAARGAAKGAVFGAIVGDSDSAKKGAALGAATGGVRRAARKSAVYQDAYDDCMAGKVKW